MSTPKELANRLEAWGLIDAVGDKYRPELQAIAAEMRSLEAQTVNVQMLDALRAVQGAIFHRADSYEVCYEWCHLCKIDKAIAAAEAAPVPESAGLVERVGWAIVCEIHTNVPEADRPMSWSDLSWEQDKRIKRAARAAIAAYESRSGSAQKEEKV